MISPRNKSSLAVAAVTMALLHPAFAAADGEGSSSPLRDDPTQHVATNWTADSKSDSNSDTPNDEQTVIPEPSAAILVLSSLGVLLFFRKRKTR